MGEPAKTADAASRLVPRPRALVRSRVHGTVPPVASRLPADHPGGAGGARVHRGDRGRRPVDGIRPRMPELADVRTDDPGHFICNADGKSYRLSYHEIIYLESLENYIRVHTKARPIIVRMPLKQAEQILPRTSFVRISRSHIVNVSHIQTLGDEALTINGERFKIGKVYKKYVAEQMSATRSNGI